jgi:hypothetical protein
MEAGHNQDLEKRMKQPTNKEVLKALEVIYASTMLEKGAKEFAANHPGATMRIHADVVVEVAGSDSCLTVREFDGYELKSSPRLPTK